MSGIADFLDSLIGGVDLVCFALIIGGLLWGVFVLRPWQQSGLNAVLLHSCISLLYKGGFALAGAQIFKIILKVWLMTAVLNRWPFPEFAETTQFVGGIIRAVLILVLAGYCYTFLRAHPFAKHYWFAALAVALPMIISGAWLVHAAGRFEEQAVLMSLTVAHQLGAAAWVGGGFQLLNIYRLHYLQAVESQLWTIMLRRFSHFGLAAIGTILLSGVPIALEYIDSLNGLVGTGYGNLLMVKIVLLGLALGFAWINRSAIEHFGISGNAYALNYRVPYYVEAETLILITLLFTAASLASQPPAIDIPSLTATWQEVLDTFAPQIPRTSSVSA